MTCTYYASVRDQKAKCCPKSQKKASLQSRHVIGHKIQPNVFSQKLSSFCLSGKRIMGWKSRAWQMTTFGVVKDANETKASAMQHFEICRPLMEYSCSLQRLATIYYTYTAWRRTAYIYTLTINWGKSSISGGRNRHYLNPSSLTRLSQACSMKREREGFVACDTDMFPVK